MGMGEVREERRGAHEDETYYERPRRSWNHGATVRIVHHGARSSREGLMRARRAGSVLRN